jgi:copper resistance protein D
MHTRILNTKTEKKLAVGNVSIVYIQAIRSKIISLGRITVILSVLILFLASLLHNGGF